MPALHGSPRIYFALIGLQAAGVTVLLREGVPLFDRLIEEVGRPQRIAPTASAPAVLAIVVMQAIYWYRLRRVPVCVPVTSSVLSHLVLFAGRLSFIFGGAMFSLVFFRHLPSLETTPDASLLMWHGLLLVGGLFALFCFAIELERLGSALRTSTE